MYGAQNRAGNGHAKQLPQMHTQNTRLTNRARPYDPGIPVPEAAIAHSFKFNGPGLLPHEDQIIEYPQANHRCGCQQGHRGLLLGWHLDLREK